MRISMQHAFVARLGFAFAFAAIAANAGAGNDPLGYRTDLFVASNKNECSGVPSCLPATMARVVVPASKKKAERFACPDSHPNLWAWDSAQHEHVTVQMVAIDRRTVTVEGVNTTSTVGEFEVSLGCSTQPYAGSVVQQSRHLAPTRFMGHQHRSEARQASPPLSTDTSVCNGIRECQVQPQPWQDIGPWGSIAQGYTCVGAYPYANYYTYIQTGSPSISAMGIVRDVTPQTYDILMTNWNLFAHDKVEVILACSKYNINGGSCGGVQRDPNCPVIGGSQHTYCNGGPVPVCIQDWNERCSANQQLYQCTDELAITWCTPCPG